MLTQASRDKIQRLRVAFPEPQSALLEALALAQEDGGGWLPDSALDEVAVVMELPPTLVASVASFYTMLNRQPVGRHLVQVCTNISCSLLRADHLVGRLGRKLGICPGETTPDGRFTLVEVECLGSCGTAPVMRIGSHTYENLTEERIDQILSELP